MSFVNTDQAEYWSRVAPEWIEAEDRLEEIGGPPGQMAMDRLGVAAGQRVVDLGCGSGRTTLELASRVGPDGQVLGVDISPGMVARGRERARGAGLQNVEFLHADVQVNDLGQSRFDAAYSRFGIMFFADPTAAFSNVRRSLRPGGVLSFVCWQSVFDNEWLLIPGAAVASVLGSLPPMPGPNEPGPFSLADPDRVRSILDAAGFRGIDVVPHSDSLVITEQRIPEVALTSTRVGAVRELLREADDVTRERVLRAIEDALRARVQDGEVRASRSILLVRAET